MDLPIVPRREPPRGFRLRYRYDYRTDTWRRQTPECYLFGMNIRAPVVIPVKRLRGSSPRASLDSLERHSLVLQYSNAHK